MLLDKTTVISKLQADAPGADKEGYVTHSGFLFNGVQSAAVRMNIQPASAELTAISEGEVFKTFKAFTRASGVVETMRVTVSGTNDTYIVRGRERFDYGVDRHYELTLAKDKR